MSTYFASVYIPLSGTRLLYLKKEERASTNEEYGEDGFERSYIDSVEVGPAIKINNTARQYILVVDNYVETIAAKRTAHISVLSW